MLTVPVPSTFSLVTVESQLAGAYRHILSTPVGVVDPTSPTEFWIGHEVWGFLCMVFSPRSFALFHRKSMMSGVQLRYMLQPALVAAPSVLIRVWNLAHWVYACNLAGYRKRVTYKNRSLRKMGNLESRFSKMSQFKKMIISTNESLIIRAE